MSPGSRRRARAAGDALLHVDWTSCRADGTCSDLLPDVLRQDRWGYPLALEADVASGDAVVPAHLVGEARRAVGLCPVLALRLRPVPGLRPGAGPDPAEPARDVLPDDDDPVEGPR